MFPQLKSLVLSFVCLLFDSIDPAQKTRNGKIPLEGLVQEERKELRQVEERQQRIRMLEAKIDQLKKVWSLRHYFEGQSGYLVS